MIGVVRFLSCGSHGYQAAERCMISDSLVVDAGRVERRHAADYRTEDVIAVVSKSTLGARLEITGATRARCTPR
jgi:hypothetical protein